MNLVDALAAWIDRSELRTKTLVLILMGACFVLGVEAHIIFVWLMMIDEALR